MISKGPFLPKAFYDSIVIYYSPQRYVKKWEDKGDYDLSSTRLLNDYMWHESTSF